MGSIVRHGYSWGKTALFCLFIFSAYAVAGVKYPPLLPTPQQQQQYILQLMQEYPWLAPTGISAQLPHYVALQQGWIAKFYQLPQFKQLNAQRPDLLTIKVQRVHREIKNVKVLPSEKIERFRREVIATVQAFPPDEATPLSDLIQTKLDRLVNSDPQKILTGLITLLPKEKRAEYFKLSLAEQLRQLSQAPDLTDQAIAQGFQANLHSLENVVLRKATILESVAELLKEEEELASLIRTRLALAMIGRETDLWELLDEDKTEQAIQLIHEAPADCFDLAATDKHLIDQIINHFGARSEKYLDRVLKALKNEERVLQPKEVPVAQDLFTIQEIIPELGVYRGLLGGDCSTSHSFAFPFSPLERVFLIFDQKGDPLRLYLAGTLVQVNQTPTFYLHDIAGPALTAEIQGLALHALYESREHLGVHLLTLPTRTVRDANAGEEPSKSPRITALIQDLDRYAGDVVNHTYLDVAVRQFLGSLQGSASDYDSPEFNAQGHSFVPKKGILKDIQVEVVGAEKRLPLAEDRPLSPKESFLRLLDLLAGEEKPEMFFDGLGIERAETERILSVVNNVSRLPLEEYYEAMRAEFGRHGIELSEKYLRKNSRYFLFGHLQAADACATTNETLSARTVQFTIETIRRGRVRQFAYDLVQANPDFFNRSREFREYVSSIPVRGADHLERLNLLLARKIDPELIQWTPERLENVVGTTLEHLLLAAIRHMQAAGATAESPLYLKLLANALKNEKHESDETSLTAADILVQLRTSDPELNKSLLATIKHDENDQIAYRAALAFIQNGQYHKKAYSRLEENTNNQKIPPRLLAIGNALLRHAPNDCAREVSDQAQKEN